MKIRRPSPGMIVALIALVVACTGSAVAAVNFAEKAGFARQAGAVDKKSAVSAGSKLSSAKGRLVATARGGRNAGRIPAKFVADITRGFPMATQLEVPDNATGGSVELLRSSFGTFSAACSDQNNTVGREDPTMTFTYTNTTGTGVNFQRRAGTTALDISVSPAGTVKRFTINNSNTFDMHLQQAGLDLLVDGVARQDGRNTSVARCVVYAAARTVGQEPGK